MCCLDWYSAYNCKSTDWQMSSQEPLLFFGLADSSANCSIKHHVQLSWQTQDHTETSISDKGRSYGLKGPEIGRIQEVQQTQGQQGMGRS